MKEKENDNNNNNNNIDNNNDDDNNNKGLLKITSQDPTVDYCVYKIR